MGIVKKASTNILWMVRHPTITIFKQDMQEWVRITADKVSFRLYKENEEKLFKYINEENHRALERIAEKAAEREVNRIGEKILGERYVVLAEGKFGTGERQCSLEDVFDVTDSLRKGLTIEILSALTSGIWTKEEIEEMNKQGKTNFEYTLSSYIPSIFKDDWSDWESGFPIDIVYSVIEEGLNWDSPEQVIREKIIDEIDKIAEELINLNSRYVNIVGDVYPIRKTATCQIVSITEFVDKLYKAAYNRSLKILAKRQNTPKKSELDEDVGY